MRPPKFPRQESLEVTPVHSSVRGRVRFKVDRLYRSPEIAHWIIRGLKRNEGIHAVLSNPLTGTVLVSFDTKVVHQKQIVEWVKILIQQYDTRTFKGEMPNNDQERQASDTTWHQKDAARVAKQLQTSPEKGLKLEEARLRLRQMGFNRLPEVPPKSEWRILLRQFENLPAGLLIGSAFLSLLTGGVVEGVAIIVVSLLNSGIGYRMESSAQKTINALLKLEKSKIKVIRSNRETLVNPEEIVPGDLCVLVPGTLVPADARLTYVERLSVDESLLTGESLPVNKSTAKCPKGRLPLADRVNMVFKGTIVTSGSGRAVAVATGVHTEIGRIQQLISSSGSPETPMERQLRILGNQAAGFALVASGTLFIIGTMRGSPLLRLLRTSISLAVAAIPESLPTIATTTIASSVKSLEKRDILIRHLDAIETLAGIDVICFDKTGTLTLNQLQVTRIITADTEVTAPFKKGASSTITQLVSVAVLCNEAGLESGSSTESALLSMASHYGMSFSELRAKFPLQSIQYRTESQNFMTTVHLAPDNQRWVAVKGSPGEVLALSKRFQDSRGIHDLTPAVREGILKANSDLAERGLRVLGFAFGSDHNNLTWLGLVGMADTVREGISQVISKFKAAGIKTAMITGDQKLTAQAIGKSIGIEKVYARVSPSEKLRIIQRIQKSGKTVAMIGDGINDGPALKASDVGIAMAARGTEAAAQAADVVLPSDNVKGIIAAIREGRRIHEDLKKAIDYIIPQNLSEIAFTFLSVLFEGREPFSPMQFLWINLVTDLLPELALAQEPAESDVLKKNPSVFKRQFIVASDLKSLGFETLILTSAPLLTYRYMARSRSQSDQAKANSTAFLSLTASSLLYTLHARSTRVTLFDRERLAKNRYIPLAVGAGFTAEFAGVLTPALRRLLRLETVTASDLVFTTLASLVPIMVVEVARFIQNNLKSGRKDNASWDYLASA